MTPDRAGSLWLAEDRGPRFAPIDGDRAVDMAVVGGIVGVTAVYLAKRGGLRVPAS